MTDLATRLRTIAAEIDERCPHAADDLRRIAIKVSRMERTLDEITAEAMESEQLIEANPDVVVRFLRHH